MSIRKKINRGFGGKYKFCEKHNIDSLSSPELFSRTHNGYSNERKTYFSLKCKICTNAYLKKYLKTYFIQDDRKDRVEKRDKRRKEWETKNKDKINCYIRIYEKERKKVDINFKVVKLLRSRMSNVLKKNIKSKSTFELTGCNLEQLKKYLESKFEDGMSWDNYGVWHLDHIIPCARFDLSDPEQQKICFHYTNLQPMWGDQNLKKGARLC